MVWRQNHKARRFMGWDDRLHCQDSWGLKNQPCVYLAVQVLHAADVAASSARGTRARQVAAGGCGRGCSRVCTACCAAGSWSLLYGLELQAQTAAPATREQPSSPLRVRAQLKPHHAHNMPTAWLLLPQQQPKNTPARAHLLPQLCQLAVLRHYPVNEVRHSLLPVSANVTADAHTTCCHGLTVPARNQQGVPDALHLLRIWLRQTVQQRLHSSVVLQSHAGSRQPCTFSRKQSR